MEDGKNIIFLDINGVLDSFNHSEAFTRKGLEELYEKHHFDWNCIHHLYEIVMETNAYIVITSDLKNKKDKMKKLLGILDFYGIADRVIGKTKTIEVNLGYGTKLDRGLEIQDYLDNHLYNNFVVIDDIPWDLDRFKDNLVLTHPRYGIQEEDKIKAINILNRSKTRHK